MCKEGRCASNRSATLTSVTIAQAIRYVGAERVSVDFISKDRNLDMKMVADELEVAVRNGSRRMNTSMSGVRTE